MKSLTGLSNVRVVEGGEGDGRARGKLAVG